MADILRICFDNICKYCDITTLLTLRLTCKFAETILYIDNKVILDVVKNNLCWTDEDCIFLFLKKCTQFNFSLLNNLILKTSVEHGYNKIVKFLLEWTPPKGLNYHYVDPTFDNNCIIQIASGLGYYQIVKLLLSWIPPFNRNLDEFVGSKEEIQSIKWMKKYMSIGGSLKIVKYSFRAQYPRRNFFYSSLVLDYVDPSVRDNISLKLAIEGGTNNHKKVIKLLQTYS
ncbi:ankyrin repeat domain-containing protein [bacterium]|nr:ankyrin repeat domain-containing protein [bacterium]